jgi:hypothetical protein
MSGGDKSKAEWETPERDEDRVSGWLVGGVIVGALIVFTFFGVGTWAQFQERERHLEPMGTSVPQELGKADINIVNTGLMPLDTRAYEEKERQRQRLHEYGWVDRDGGLVHLPIEQGIERVVAGQRQRRDGGGP